MTTVDDLFNKEEVKAAIEQIDKVVTNEFEKIDVLAITWIADGTIHHRAYGDLTEIVGLLERVKWIMCREETAETEPETDG